MPDVRERSELRADCQNCFGLCCVAPAFAASADFAIDKPAGQPCPHLRADFRCNIHQNLRLRGFPGCAVYDCFGAGQRVAQLTFGGRDWRRDPHLAKPMFEAFAVMRQLHELLWYLNEALGLLPAAPLRAEMHDVYEQTERLTRITADALLALDIAAHRHAIGILLRRASELGRADRLGADRGGADLIAADLRGCDLGGASLRGACLIGADLRGADLRFADLLGADLRGAKLGGADLRDSVFLTQAQLDATAGDRRTRLPPSLHRPAHWTAPGVAPATAPSAEG